MINTVQDLLPLRLNHCPLTPMTQTEMIKQCNYISKFLDEVEEFREDDEWEL